MAGYYDIRDILAEEEKVPVVLRVGLPGVGHALDPSAQEDDLQQGSKLELPFWILPMFLSRSFVSVMDSKKFGTRLRKEVQADAGCVNLKSVSPFFYTYGLKLAPVVPDTTLGLFLLMTFVERYGEVLVKCLSSAEQELGPVKRLLSQEELESQTSVIRYQEWQQRQHTLIKASSILGKSRSKRLKLVEDQDGNSQRAQR